LTTRPRVTKETTYTVDFITNPDDTSWHFRARLSADSATFQINDSQLLPGLPERYIPHVCPLDHFEIATVIQQAATYHWHLRREPTPKEAGREGNRRRLRDCVSAMLMELEIHSYDEDGVASYLPKKGGKHQAFVVDEPLKIAIKGDGSELFGLELKNKADRKIFVVSCCFDSDLRIELLSTAVVTATKDKVPVTLPEKGIQTYGYGCNGGGPFTFELKEGQNTDIFYLKMFLSTEPIDLDHIEQSSPFDPSEDSNSDEQNRGMKRVTQEPMVLPSWDTVLIPIIQNRS